jgi:glycosyltransferase involved in cell wall biosynthesis
MLCSFATSLSVSPTNSILSFAASLPEGWISNAALRLKRRAWLDPSLGATISNPLPELARIGAKTLKLHSLFGLPEQRLTDFLYRRHDHFTATKCQELMPSHVWCYEDAALHTFRKAKELGITTIYELPLVYYKAKERALETALVNAPELNATREIIEPAEKLAAKDEELQLADIVIVPSEYAKSCLPSACLESKIVVVIPYGANTTNVLPQRSSAAPFTALAVGHVNVRKGAHDLLSAWRELNLKDAQLDFIGTVDLPKKYLQQITNDSVSLHGGKPHSQLHHAYQHADVLVFPTYCDGFGLVVLEAMAMGLPVIASTCSGAPHVIEDGVDGFLIKPGDQKRLKELLTWCASNREALLAMGAAASAKAATWTWERYASSLTSALGTLTHNHS